MLVVVLITVFSLGFIADVAVLADVVAIVVDVIPDCFCFSGPK